MIDEDFGQGASARKVPGMRIDKMTRPTAPAVLVFLLAGCVAVDRPQTGWQPTRRAPARLMLVGDRPEPPESIDPEQNNAADNEDPPGAQGQAPALWDPVVTHPGASAPLYESFWERWSLAASAAAVIPMDKGATILDRGIQYSAHATFHFTPFMALDISGGYYQADVRQPFSDPLEAGTFQVAAQFGGEMLYDLGRWYVTPGVGLFILDAKDEDAIGEDLDASLQLGLGAEFWTLGRPLRTRLEASYLYLVELEEDFGVIRLTMLVKF